MSWKGALLRAGILSDGVNITLPGGNFAARNFIVPSGNTWYVNKNNSVTGNGTSWELAFKTIAEAVAAASDYDTILIEEGVYDEGVVLNITQVGLRIFGMNTTNYMFGTTSIKASAANHICITINANQVEIAFLSFIQNNAKSCITIDPTASVYKTHIHDCHFGTTAATYGVYAGGTMDAVDTIVERCSFTVGAAVGVYINGTRCAVIDCSFNLAAGGTAIQHYPNTTDRPYARYLGNKIMGVNSTDTGILISQAPTLGCLTVFDNVIENVATPITLAKSTKWYANNYFGVLDHLYHPDMQAVPNLKNNVIWHVDAAVATTGDGRCWKSAFKTILEAVAAASAFDAILVAAGDYDEGAVIPITTEGLKIIGAGDMNRNVAMIYNAGGAAHLMTINAHQVEILNMGFSAAASAKDAIRLGDTQTSYKCRIAGCRLDGWSGRYGIITVDDCPDLVIEDNVIRSWNTAGIQLNCTRALVRRNIFHVVTDCIGLEHVSAAGDRPDSVYVENLFSGIANATTTGIKFTGAPNNGTCIVARNIFAGTFDTAITKVAAFIGVWNYVSDNGGGNTLVDTVT